MSYKVEVEHKNGHFPALKHHSLDAPQWWSSKITCCGLEVPIFLLMLCIESQYQVDMSSAMFTSRSDWCKRKTPATSTPWRSFAKLTCWKKNRWGEGKRVQGKAAQYKHIGIVLVLYFWYLICIWYVWIEAIAAWTFLDNQSLYLPYRYWHVLGICLDELVWHMYICKTHWHNQYTKSNESLVKKKKREKKSQPGDAQ